MNILKNIFSIVSKISNLGLNKLIARNVKGLGFLGLLIGMYFGLDKDTTQQLMLVLSNLTILEFSTLLFLFLIVWIIYLLIKSVFVYSIEDNKDTIFTYYLKNKFIVKNKKGK